MQLTIAEFDILRALLQSLCGLALSPQKEYLIRSRLEPVLERFHLTSYGELILRLQSGQDIAFREAVIDAMMTKETSFHRDGHPFEELRRSIMPEMIRILEHRRGQGIVAPRIRIWSIPCSTGQEPYSISMCIHEFFEGNPNAKGKPSDFWILASDISQQALSVAKEGVYNDFEMERGIASQQRAKYFTPLGAKWRVVDSVRSLIEYRAINVLQSFADCTGFDMIFCRNMLIYFDEATRDAVCDRLAKSLNPGGLLFLGAAEHLPKKHDRMLRQKHFGRTVVYAREA